jgi:hypothetical protein
MKVEELKTLLKRYGFDDEDPLLSWLNAAYHEIENAYEKWSWLEGEELKESAVGEVVLASSIKRMIKLRDVTSELSTGGEGVDLEYMDRRKFMREFPNLLTTGEPEAFTIIGSSKLQVYPVPSSARQFRATFIKALPDLVGNAEEPLIPVSDHYTIVRGAAYLALESENEEERAATAQAQFESALDKMITNDSIRQIGEPGQVEDVMEYG